MKKVKLSKLRYIGVFARNTLPVKFYNNQCCIFNNLPDSTSGEHWLALVKSANHVYIYDSFGRSNEHFGLPRKYIQSDSKPEQVITENNCGYRCIAYIQTFDKFGKITAEYL